MSGGSLTGDATLAISESLTWSGGTMSGAGRTQVMPNATATVTGGVLSRRLENLGAMTLTNSLDGFTGGLLDNQGRLTLNKEGAYALRVSGSGAAAQLWNRGANDSYVLTYQDQAKDVFDSTGRLLRQLDRHGYATTVSYDVAGRIDHVSDEAGRRLTYAYDTSGRIAQITDPLGRDVSYAYDANGDLSAVSDAGGEVWRYGYDSGHRVVSMTDPRGHQTTNRYDDSGRVLEQTDPKNGTITFAYTDASTTVTDARGHATRYELAGGLTAKVIEGVGTAQQSVVSMLRDASGNVTQRTDPDGQITTVEYDAAGNAT